MNLRTGALWVVFRKDLLDLIRDRRTLFAVVVLPLLFYPLLFIGFSQMSFLQNRKLEQEVPRIQIQGLGNAPALVNRLEREKGFQLTSFPQPEQALAKGELDLVLTVPPGFQDALNSDKTARVELIQDSSRDRSSAARRKVEAFLQSYAKEIRETYLTQKGMDPSSLTLMRIDSMNIVSPQKVWGKLLGLLLPFLLVQMTLLG
ncbi:MAG: hypothetical protein HYU64_06020, partial [Armatimonadetes bacterium]|nr:hypothetical protein [Armatimonadota bacterium]